MILCVVVLISGVGTMISFPAIGSKKVVKIIDNKGV